MTMMAALCLVTAGCAPGDISRYTARVQRAGEAMFEGEAQQTALMEDGAPEEETAFAASQNPEEAAAEEESGAEESGTTEETVGEKDTVLAEGGEALSLSEAAEAASFEKKVEKTIEMKAAETAETESTGAETEASAEEDAKDKESSQDFGEDTTAQGGQAELSGAEREAARIQAEMEKKADCFTGHLTDRDAFDAAEEEALQAVLAQANYQDARLCLSNRIQTGKTETSTFLLLFERAAFVNRGRVCGDLWFYAEEKAVRLLKDVQAEKLARYEAGGQVFLLVQTDRNGKTGAQVYRVQDGKASGCFVGAADISAVGDGLCVTYRTEYVRYAPDGWADQQGELPCFYQWEETEFVQQSLRELGTEEYLAFLAPGEDEESLAWKKRQEERFLASSKDGEEEYRYRFFALGESRVGYQECRISVPAEDRERSDATAVAEYRYEIFELENGKLTMRSSSHVGEGYYFADWENRQEELAELFAVPAFYGKNQIGRASGGLGSKERAALTQVVAAGGYGAEELCFVRWADYDGDGEKEGLVAAGHYDGIFGVPVCDVWLVKGEETTLLEEGLPVKNVLSFQSGQDAFFLLEGYMAAGAQDRLYGQEDGAVCRLLPGAVRLEAADNGDVTAWFGGADGEMPRYYHWTDGTLSEYEAAEMSLQALLAYENGEAVVRHLVTLHLTRSAELTDGGLSCVRQDNGLFHVMYRDRSGSACYETYRVREEALVLIDCGTGGLPIAKTAKEEDSAGR